MCVRNSRVNPENDNYTYMYVYPGCSVADYMIIPCASLDNISKCSVKIVSDICEEYSLTPPSRNTSDHSVLCCEWDLYSLIRLTSTHSDTEQSNKDMQPGVSRRVYQVRNIPADVFATERASNVLFQVAEN